MEKNSIYACSCISFIFLILAVMLGVLAYTEADLNGCGEYNCTYTPKEIDNRHDCLVSLVNKINENECFTNEPKCPNTTLCWISFGSLDNCPSEKCYSLKPIISLGIISGFFMLLSILSCTFTIFKFNQIMYQLNMYRRLEI